MVWRTRGVACRLALCLAAGCLFCMVPAFSPGADPSPPAGQHSDHQDVLAEVLRLNSGDFPPPPAPTRRGSVTKGTMRGLSVQESKGSFRVRVANGEPVLSPAVADGKVFVGGGFSSHKFYCLSAETGRPKWVVNLSDNGPSYPSYGAGTVTFTTESCTCYVLDAETGDCLWSIWLGDPVISSPTVAGDRVLVSYPASVPLEAQAAGAVVQGYVFAARELRTGRPLWQKWIDHHVISAPVVDGENVYVVTFAGTLYKFRLSDGEILMARRCLATSAPILLDGAIYLTRRGDKTGRTSPQECLVKLDPETGKQLFSVHRCDASYLAPAGQRRQPAAGEPIPEPDDSAERVAPRILREPLPGDPDYMPGGGPPVIAAPASAATRLVGRDSPKDLQMFCGSRLAAFDWGIFNCMGGKVWATDPVTGERKWDLVLPNGGGGEAELAAPPALADGKLFVATRGGEVLRIDPIDGRIKARASLGAPAASQPVIDGGKIFIGTAKGDLVCFKTKNPRLTGWNQWGGNGAHSGVARGATAPKQFARTR